MPTPRSTNSGSQLSQGPIEQALAYTEKILELESQLRVARILRRLIRLCIFSIFGGAFSLYIFNVLAWHDHVVKLQVNWPVSILLILMTLYVVIYYTQKTLG
jgi:hypothetical protein